LLQEQCGSSFPGCGRIIEFERALSRKDLNRRDFPVKHNLAENDVFDLPRLVELARTIAMKRPDDVAGHIEIGQRWSESPKIDLAVDQTIQRIETSNAWIILR